MRKPQALAQQIGERLWRERGGYRGVPGQRGKGDMRRHDAFSACRDTLSERSQLDGLQSLRRRGDDWQRQMRIDGGVAMAGEMLERGDHSRALQSAHGGDAKPPDPFGIGAKRAHANHRIFGRIVDIHHRREVHVDAMRL